MARLKSEEILRQQKDAKMKKVLLVLGPIFLALMVWQGPGYLKMLTGGDEPVAAPTTETPTTPSGTTPGPTTAPPPSTAAPGGVPTPAPSATPAALTDSDRPPPADAGQLVSFDRFVGKDPFRQIVDADATDDGPTVTPAPADPGGSGGSGAGSGGAGGGSDGGGDGGSNDDAQPASAVLEVNDVKEKVALKAAFPKSEKLFVLTKLSRTSAWIGLVAGEYSNGKGSIEIERGKTLNLVSQPDGIRYRIKLVGIRLS
jgi:hypothetical protein